MESKTSSWTRNGRSPSLVKRRHSRTVAENASGRVLVKFSRAKLGPSATLGSGTWRPRRRPFAFHRPCSSPGRRHVDRLRSGLSIWVCAARRRLVRHQQRARTRGLDAPKRCLELHHASRRSLGPVDVAFVDGRQRSLRRAPRGLSFHQHRVAHAEHCASLRLPHQGDRAEGAKRRRFGLVRAASAPRRIGRLDLGT